MKTNQGINLVKLIIKHIKINLNKQIKYNNEKQEYYSSTEYKNHNLIKKK